MSLVFFNFFAKPYGCGFVTTLIG